MQRLWLVLGVVAGFTLPSFAEDTVVVEEETVTSPSHREDDRLGLYASLWGDPFPALLGASVAYNVYDFLRVTGSVGTESAENRSATTLGAGLKFMIPELPLTPVAGVNFSAETDTQTWRSRGLTRGGSRFYFNVGVDWQTGVGLALGAGYNQAFTGDVGGGTPYLTAGFFL